MRLTLPSLGGRRFLGARRERTSIYFPRPTGGVLVHPSTQPRFILRNTIVAMRATAEEIAHCHSGENAAVIARQPLLG